MSSKNVGRLIAPEWVHTDVIVEVTRVMAWIHGVNQDLVEFSYRLNRVTKSGKPSKYTFGRGVTEAEIDLHNDK